MTHDAGGVTFAYPADVSEMLELAAHLSTIEVGAGEYDEVEVRGDTYDPVELRQVVVESGDDKDAHEVRRVRRTPASIARLRVT